VVAVGALAVALFGAIVIASADDHAPNPKPDPQPTDGAAVPAPAAA
jgi:hypothetical protein